MIKKKEPIKFLIIFFFSHLLLFSQDDGNSFYREALKIIERDQNLEEANYLLDKAIEKDSTNRDFLMLKSRILFSKSDCSNSFLYLKKVILLDKKFSDSTAVFFSDLADCLNDKSTAIEVLEYHLKKNNSDIVKTSLAQKYFLIGEFEKSISIYKELVYKNQNDIDAIVDLSRILFSFISKDEAIAELNNGLKHNPNNIKLLTYLASCYHNMKNYEDAIRIINSLIKIDYKTEHIASRAILYELQGKKHDAYKDYKKIIELNKCNLEYYAKILQYEFENRHYEEVIQNSFKLIECDKKNEKTILDVLYTSFFFNNDIKKGLYYLDKKIELKKNEFQPYYIKSLVLIKKGEYENVIKYLDLALKCKDVESRNITQIKFLKFCIYLLIEDYERLVDFCRSENIKELKNNLNLNLVENSKTSKVEIVVDFNKTSGIINTTLEIPITVIELLKNKYNIELNIN